MKPAKNVLSDVFSEEAPLLSVTYRHFLREPADGTYAVRAPLRIGDHYNGEKTDIPFHDRLLMPMVRTFIGMVNAKLDPSEQIYLYIPAHITPKDRVILVCGNDENKTAQVFCTLRDISRAYRNDELETLNLTELIAETLERVRDPSFKTDFEIANRPLTPKVLAKMSPERMVALYLQGEDLESIISSNDAEHGVGRIKFHEDLIVESFDGTREESYLLLKKFLSEKLSVTMKPAPHHLHCVDLHGAKDQVHMAYLIGKRVAPQINNCIKLKPIWLENAMKDAKKEVGAQKTRQFLQRNRQQGLPDFSMAS